MHAECPVIDRAGKVLAIEDEIADLDLLRRIAIYEWLLHFEAVVIGMLRLQSS